MPIACVEGAEGCSDTGLAGFGAGADLVMAGGFLLVAVLAVVVAVVLIRRRSD